MQHLHFLQEAAIGFSKAVRDYQVGKSSFSTFVDLCVHRQLITFLKGIQRMKHAHFNKAFSLDAQAPGNPIKNTKTLHDLVGIPASFDWMESQAHQAFLTVLTNQCSKLEQNVLSGLFEGYSYGELAHQNGVRCKSVDNALQRARSKAKKLLQTQPQLAEYFSKVPLTALEKPGEKRRPR